MNNQNTPSHAGIILTGSAGFLAWNVARHFNAADWEVTGTWHRTPPDPSVLTRSVHLDLGEGDLHALFDAGEAEAVVHCAALSSRIDCESDPARARQVNVDASRRLAEIARERGVRFVFISTDLVFDGDKAPYREEDAVSPISLYGETKAEAEKAILSVNPESYLIRTALMYGNGAGRNAGSFLAWTLDALRIGNAVHLYTNQFRTPLYAPDVPRFIELLLSRGAAPGIYHAAGPDRLSRFEIGQRVAASYGLSADGVIVPALVERPAGAGPNDDCSLLTEKAAAVGMHFTNIDDGLRALRQ